MDLVLLILAMIGVGLVIGALAGRIFRAPRPYGLGGDLAIGVVVAVVIGLLDWYVIPAMGFSDTIKILGIVTEPALGALAVLWLVRRAA
jgi:uncharacterized membrane protein YeaQ/YmgE (transglycosylase-associated protein family)